MIRTQAEITEILSYLVGLLDQLSNNPALAADVRYALAQNRRFISEGMAVLEYALEAHYKKINRQINPEPAECGRVNFLRRKILALFSPALPQATTAAILEGQLLRIAFAGETSAGKTALLNTLLDTDLFFVTQEASTRRPTEIRRDPLLRVEALDRSGLVRDQLRARSDWFADSGYVQLKEEYRDLVRDFITLHAGLGAGETEQMGVGLTDAREAVIGAGVPGFPRQADPVRPARDAGYAGAGQEDASIPLKNWLTARIVRKSDRLQTTIPSLRSTFRNKRTTEDGRPFAMRTFSAVSGASPTVAESAEKVRVYLPSPALPQNVVLLDTPGFNAYGTDMRFTEQELANCHACVFVIDARNALKSKELENIRRIRALVDHVYLVLNKMDLVSGDEELDSDGDEAAAATITRVRELLSAEFGSQATVYPVSALPGKRLSQETQSYAENLWTLFDEVFEQVARRQIAWLTGRLIKDVLEMAPAVSELVYRSLLQYEAERQKILRLIPQPLGQFTARINDNLQNSMFYHASAYHKEFLRNLEEKRIVAQEQFQSWLEIVRDKPALKKDAQLFARYYLKQALESIDVFRNQGLQKIAQALNRDLAGMLEEIYRDFPFVASFQSGNVINILISLISLEEETAGKDLGQVLEETDYEKELTAPEVTEAPPGLAMLNSVGVLLGGAIGKYLTNSTLEYTKQKISQTFQVASAKLMEDVAVSGKGDLDYARPVSFINQLKRAAEQQLAIYEDMVKEEIAVYKEKHRQAEEQLTALKEAATAIADTFEELNPI